MKLFLRNGVYYIRFDRHSKMSLKTGDKRIALSLFKKAEREHLAGRIKALDESTPISLNDFEIEFFSRHTDIAPDTERAYALAFKLMSEAFGKTMPIARITSSRLDEFKAKCLARGVKKVSINTYMRHIRGILNKAHEWGRVKVNTKVELLTIPKRHPRILTKAEIKKILEYARDHDPEMWRIITFALWTGARRAEISSLTWGQVSKDTCRLVGKGDKERTVPLLPGAIAALGARKDVGKVFHIANDVSRITKAFKAICRKCGIMDAHLHHLRHTAATSMLSAGFSIEVVREILGHADIRTTEIYAKVLQKKIMEEAFSKGMDLYG